MGKTDLIERTIYYAQKYQFREQEKVSQNMRSTAVYWCESWTVRIAENKKLESLEMWYYRRILKEKLTSKITKEYILIRAGEETKAESWKRRSKKATIKLDFASYQTCRLRSHKIQKIKKLQRIEKDEERYHTNSRGLIT